MAGFLTMVCGSSISPRGGFDTVMTSTRSSTYREAVLSQPYSFGGSFRSQSKRPGGLVSLGRDDCGRLLIGAPRTKYYGTASRTELRVAAVVSVVNIILDGAPSRRGVRTTAPVVRHVRQTCVRSTTRSSATPIGRVAGRAPHCQVRYKLRRGTMGIDRRISARGTYCRSSSDTRIAVCPTAVGCATQYRPLIVRCEVGFISLLRLWSKGCGAPRGGRPIPHPECVVAALSGSPAVRVGSSL